MVKKLQDSFHYPRVVEGVYDNRKDFIYEISFNLIPVQTKIFLRIKNTYIYYKFFHQYFQDVYKKGPRT
jgi:hypothetical protein